MMPSAAALAFLIQVAVGSATAVPDPALIAEARADAPLFRERVAAALDRFLRAGDDAAAQGALVEARRMAAAHGAAWRDPYLPRRVERLAAWTDEQKRAGLTADSLRREGVAVFSRDGPKLAAAIWQRSVRAALAASDTAAAAAALANIGAALLRQGLLDEAQRRFEEARRLALRVGDRAVQANATGALASILAERSDYAGARARYDASLELREAIGDTRGAAADRNNLGLLALELGELGSARTHFSEALDANRAASQEVAAATNLVNLGLLLALEGEFTRAVAMYREALTIYRADELVVDAADALAGLGQLELRRGDYRAARAAFEEALALYLHTELFGDAVAVGRQLASALGALGDVQGAIDALRRAEQLADSAAIPLAERAGLLLAQGDLALALNAVEEADRSYFAAEQLYSAAADPVGVAEARQGRGTVALERDDRDRARQLLEGALRAQQAAGLRRAAASTLVLLARAHADAGELDRARALLREAVNDLVAVSDPVAEAVALGELASLEAENGAWRTADSLFTVALARVGERAASETTWPLLLGRGLARRSGGAVDAGVADLISAIDEIERTSGTLRIAERRSAFRADKWDAYAQLVASELRRGRNGAAFQASERLRAREMLELLGRGRIAPPPLVPGELVAREQDLRRRIDELVGAVELAGDARDPDPQRATTLLAALRAEYADLLVEMRERAVDDADLIAPSAPSWRDVARRLEPDAALIEYLVSDSAVVAFVVTTDTLAVVDLGIGEHELSRLVEFGRAMLEDPGSGDRWRAPLRRLRRHLIDPVEGAGLLDRARSLVIAPHRELHYLPFSALLDESGRFLVERRAIEYTPSASVWLRIGERPRSAAAEGVLIFAPHPDELPGAAREAAVVAAARGGTEVRTGEQASEASFRTDASMYRELHLATYGVLVKENPLFSWVELAAGDGHDGRLEVHEVFGLSLNADLVVLSACETGLGSGVRVDVPPGDDWVGLSRAFLHAGARQVVATLWPVDDASTAALMQRLHQQLAEGAAASVALRAAQQSMLTRGATAHPYHWAGVTVVGAAP